MNIYMDNIYIVYGYINIWFVGDFSKLNDDFICYNSK